MISNWSDINVHKFKENPELFSSLKKLYGEDGLTNIDLYIGGKSVKSNILWHNYGNIKI